MPVLTEVLEDAIITKIRVAECIKEFDSEIQKIFYNAYGEKLEAFPKELLLSGLQAEDLLGHLLKMGSVRNQKIILMRFGIATGTAMSLEEVSKELRIPRERVRQIENMFIRRCHPHIKRRTQIGYE